jgi:hypothetical protein
LHDSITGIFRSDHNVQPIQLQHLEQHVRALNGRDVREFCGHALCEQCTIDIPDPVAAHLVQRKTGQLRIICISIDGERNNRDLDPDNLGKVVTDLPGSQQFTIRCAAFNFLDRSVGGEVKHGKLYTNRRVGLTEQPQPLHIVAHPLNGGELEIGLRRGTVWQPYGQRQDKTDDP